MENYTSNNEGLQTSKFQIIIKWVLIAFVASIASTIMTQVIKGIIDSETELNVVKIIGFLSVAIIAFSIFSGIKEYRNTVLGDYMTFGKGFRFGMTISLYLIILNTLFMLIYFNLIIDFDTYIADQLDTTLKTINAKKQNQSEESVKGVINMTKKFMTKEILIGSSALFALFMYTIVSLISAAILKKEIKND